MPYQYKRTEIDRLIPDAMREAEMMVKLTGGVEVEERIGRNGVYNHCMITQYFHRAMNRMAAERDLRIL